jgi:hypothetical protein
MARRTMRSADAHRPLPGLRAALGMLFLLTNLAMVAVDGARWDQATRTAVRHVLLVAQMGLVAAILVLVWDARRRNVRPLDPADLVPGPPLYEESQPQGAGLWVAILIAPCFTVACAWAMWPGPLDADLRGFALFLGAAGFVGIAVLPWVGTAMHTTVSQRLVAVRFGPLAQPERIATRSIGACRVVRYSPRHDVRGEGCADTRPGLRAFRVRGDRGVLLTIEGAWPVLIGSREPERLAEVLALLGVRRLPGRSLCAAMGWRPPAVFPWRAGPAE